VLEVNLLCLYNLLFLDQSTKVCLDINAFPLTSTHLLPFSASTNKQTNNKQRNKCTLPFDLILQTQRSFIYSSILKMKSILFLLLSILAVVIAKTDLEGCASSEVVVDGVLSRTFYLCPSFISGDVPIPTTAASTTSADIIASVLVGRHMLHDTPSCPPFSASASDSISSPPASPATTLATSAATELREQPATTSYSASLITSSVSESESHTSTASLEESSSLSLSTTTIASVPTAVATSSTIASPNAAVAIRPAVLALGGLAIAAALVI